MKANEVADGFAHRDLPAHGLVDWFVPDELLQDADARRRARMFVIGHVLGSPLGLLIAFELYFLDPAPGAHLLIIALSIVAFLAFPFALRLGAPLIPLSLVTLQLLTLVVLYGCYNYGGVSSPFLCWLLTVPLLGLLYFGTSVRLRVLVLALLIVNIGVFCAVRLVIGRFPTHVPLAALAGVGIFSLLCGVIFVSMLALYYTSILAAQQRELEREVQKQRVTEGQLIQARDEAERANRAKSAFLANMGHELRTPLNAIIGFSEIMLCEVSGHLGDARYRGYIKDIRDSGQHLLKVINDVLDLSNIEAGRMALDEEREVGLTEIIDSVTHVIELDARQKGVQLRAEIGDALPSVFGSARALEQIALNLLSNAVKFTPPGGTVTIQAFGTNDGSVHLAIRDTGIGMTAADIAVALTPFGQVECDLNRKYEGTGLGLPLTKALAALHGGTMRIDSVSYQGTTVEVVLPRKRKAAARHDRFLVNAS